MQSWGVPPSGLRWVILLLRVLLPQVIPVLFISLSWVILMIRNLDPAAEDLPRRNLAALGDPIALPAFLAWGRLEI